MPKTAAPPKYSKLRRRDLTGCNDWTKRHILEAMEYSGVLGRRTSKGHFMLIAGGGRTLTVPPNLDGRNRGTKNAERDMRHFLNGLTRMASEKTTVRTVQDGILTTIQRTKPIRQTAVSEALQRAVDESAKRPVSDRAAEVPGGTRMTETAPEGTAEVQPATKRCSRCGLTLPVTDFGKKKAAPDGLQPACKKCTNARQMERKRGAPLERRGGDRRSRFANAPDGETGGDVDFETDRQSGVDVAANGLPPQPPNPFNADRATRVLQALDDDLAEVEAQLAFNREQEELPPAPDPGPEDLPEPEPAELLEKIRLMLWTPAERRRIASMHAEIHELTIQVGKLTEERDEALADARRLRTVFGQLAELGAEEIDPPKRG